MYTTHLNGYPTTIEQDKELLKQELTQNHKNAVDFRLGEKVICKYFIDTSTYALAMLMLTIVQAQQMINKLPAGLDGMRSYLTGIILPIFT